MEACPIDGVVARSSWVPKFIVEVGRCKINHGNGLLTSNIGETIQKFLE